MPTTVAATNGNTYHLWQLGDLTAPEPEDGIEFSTLDNEMSEGYRSSSLFGLNTGIRSWRLNMPTLAGSTVIAAAVTDPYAATVSREDYVRNLYKYNTTTGIPFAYRDTNSNQYYLVDFVNDSLTMAKKKIVDIYDTTIELRQRRLNGVTIFDVAAATYDTDVGSYTWCKGNDFSTPVWSNSGSGVNMDATGGVSKISADLNGKDIVRFDGSSGYVTNGPISTALYELFLVMKMTESTFSNAAGVASTGVDVLVGSSGTTKFANPGLSASNYTYRKNGTEYAQSDLQAPMNVWGIVHVRYQTGWSGSDLTLGHLAPSGTAYAKMDVAEVVGFGNSSLSTLASRELTEYLAVKYAISLD